jgi:hypothetical protein
MCVQRSVTLLARKLASYYPFYILTAHKTERIGPACLAEKSGSADFLDSDDCQADV